MATSRTKCEAVSDENCHDMPCPTLDLRLLKVPVHVAGKDEASLLHARGPAAQNVEAHMGLGAPVQRESVTEAPAKQGYAPHR